MVGKPDEAYKTITIRQSLNLATRTASANGAAVDCSLGGGVDSVLFYVRTSTITDGTHTFSCEESADGSTGWTQIPAGRIHGSLPVLTNTNSNSSFEWGASTSLRYVRAVVTVSGATTGGSTSCAVALVGSHFEAH